MFADLARRLGESSVEVFAGERPGERGGGSGVIVSEDGWIATNAHVVRSRAPVVRLVDGRQFRGQLVDADKQRDLAILRIDVGSLVPATLGDSKHHPSGRSGGRDRQSVWRRRRSQYRSHSLGCRPMVDPC